MKFLNWFFFFFGLAFSVAGSVLACQGLQEQTALRNVPDSWIKTDAVISDISWNRTHSSTTANKTNYDVTITYSADDRPYSCKLDYFVSSMKEGDAISIYYNPKNPKDYIINSSTLFDSKMLAGCGFALIGLIFMLYSIIVSYTEGKLKRNGIHISIPVTNAELDTTTKINKKHPVCLYCQYTNPLTGEALLFKSKPHPNRKLLECIGQKVDIYYDPDKPKKYYFDYSEILKELRRLV